MHARRVRHRQALADDGVAGDVDDDAAIGTAVAPAVDGIRARYRGDVARLAVFHRQPVEMAAILVDQRRDEGRLPHQFETVARRHRGETVVAGVDEQHAAVGVEADIVRVEAAGDVDAARHVAGVEGLVDALFGFEHVLEAHDLVAGGHDQAGRAVAAQAHRLGHRRLMDVDAALRVAADEIEQARLVGGEGEGDVAARQPLRQPGRDRVFDPGRRGRGGIGGGGFRLVGHGAKILRRGAAAVTAAWRRWRKSR